PDLWIVSLRGARPIFQVLIFHQGDRGGCRIEHDRRGRRQRGRVGFRLRRPGGWRDGVGEGTTIVEHRFPRQLGHFGRRQRLPRSDRRSVDVERQGGVVLDQVLRQEIGRASCRERG